MQTFGKYQLVRKLAVGGMAEVFVARADGPKGFQKTLVLKRVLPHLAEDPVFTEMFLAEAKIAASLDHPNVVQVFDFGEVDGAYYLAMEHVDGPNLRTLNQLAWQQKRPPPFPLAAKLIALACEGLAYAHAFRDPATGELLGLVHRDVSPDNLIVSRSGAVKVVDFGIAKATAPAKGTQSGLLKGKFAYMPPEQLAQRPLDRRADVFALGMVFYELLCGALPFDEVSEALRIQAMLRPEPIPPIRSKRADVPPALQRIVERALSKAPAARYADCRAMQHDLEAFLGSVGQTVPGHLIADWVQALAPPHGATPAALSAEELKNGLADTHVRPLTPQGRMALAALSQAPTGRTAGWEAQAAAGVSFAPIPATRLARPGAQASARRGRGLQTLLVVGLVGVAGVAGWRWTQHEQASTQPTPRTSPSPSVAATLPPPSPEPGSEPSAPAPSQVEVPARPDPEPPAAVAEVPALPAASQTRTTRRARAAKRPSWNLPEPSGAPEVAAEPTETVNPAEGADAPTGDSAAKEAEPEEGATEH